MTIEDPKAGIETYRRYLAVRNHFKTGYDYFKYSGKMNAKESTYLKRKDKIFFHKAEKNHKGEIVDFLVANFVEGNEYIRDMKESALNYWKKICGALEYHVSQDLNKILVRSNGDFQGSLRGPGHPLVFKMYLANEINIQTICVLQELTKFLDQMEDDPVSEEYVQFIKKLSPFISFDKKRMASKLREMIEDE